MFCFSFPRVLPRTSVRHLSRWAAFGSLSFALLGACDAIAHVTIDGGTVQADATVKLAFRVGHACPGAAATTGITVRIPAAFGHAQPMPKAGWTLTMGQTPAPDVAASAHASHAAAAMTQVRWVASSPEAALPGAFYDEFVLRGHTPAAAGPLWFQVVQECDQGSADWAEIPATGTSTRGLSRPAALLNVVPAGAAESAGSGVPARPEPMPAMAMPAH